MSKAPKTTDKSQVIIDDIKRKKLTEIFRLLDSDNDGSISAS